uniref:Cerebellin 18 n=1 Tax=Erpetoichthys calabaricus TaxID=27687 RepID=A0A8C4XC18_ERPCA
VCPSSLLSILLLLFLTPLTCPVTQEGQLPCGGWDCNCAFQKKTGCCCGANQLSHLEDFLLDKLTYFDKQVGSQDVAFTALLGRTDCYGPFTSSNTVPYKLVLVNNGNWYNPSLGVFTAPMSGIYRFSFTSSSLEGQGRKIYHQLNLMRNTEVMVSTWEDNYEDLEDSASQSVMMRLEPGDQVYVRLQAGRYLCGDAFRQNSFSGHMVFPVGQLL